MLAAIQTDASLESELDELLTESISHAHERQKSWLKNPQKPIVIFGTGRIGRKLLVGLRANNIEPVLFVDYNSENWGTFIDGLRSKLARSGCKTVGKPGAVCNCYLGNAEAKSYGIVLPAIYGLRMF